MSEMRELLIENASKVFSDLCKDQAYTKAENGEWNPYLWKVLDDNGFPDATRTPERGGPGSDLGDALAIIRAAGGFCLPAPLAETMLAELGMAAAGFEPRKGVATVGPVILDDRCTIERNGSGWSLFGTARRIPWARHADYIVLLADAGGHRATVIAPSMGTLIPGHNFANEPRDTIHFDGVQLQEDAVSLRESGLTVMDLRFYGALFRVAAMTGALEKLLDMTIQYAMERKQFGRPIAKFQAVQQQIAVMASQVAAANAAADAMVEALNSGNAPVEIAAAKARVSEAAGVAAAIAHQIHGAMGFTLEHPLQRSTRRLWSWRDEFGAEHDWAGWLGDIVVRLGSEGLWPFLTAELKTPPNLPT